jgi:hypothetical protein
MLRFHTATTEDGTYIACVCSIGADHDEADMEDLDD